MTREHPAPSGQTSPRRSPPAHLTPSTPATEPGSDRHSAPPTALARPLQCLCAMNIAPRLDTAPVPAQPSEVVPVGEFALETSLIAFDRLFDPRNPLRIRDRDGWTLTPYIPPARRGGLVAMEARRLRATGAHVLRLSRHGEPVAVAAVHPSTPADAPAPLALAA